MRKLTYQEVKEYIESFGYKLLSKEYINNNDKLDVICSNGHVYKTTFNNFKGSKNRNGRRCPHCANEHKGEYNRRTFEDVKQEIESIGYILLSNEYKNNNTKLDIMCPMRHKFKMTYSGIQQGHRCQKCMSSHVNDNNRLTYEYVKQEIEKEKHELLSETYSNNREKMLLKCPEGHEFKMCYDKFKQGYRCPHCAKSKGEDKISDVLDKFQINYDIQYRFEGCKLKRTLPFDFYLPKYNICIEFDGIQHFKPIDFAGKGKEWAMDSFIGTIIRDTVKKTYCKNNNIKLIRIPYWEFDNIEKIIVNELELG